MFLVDTLRLLPIFRPALMQCRFLEKKPYFRRWGYNEKILNRGLLPRIKNARPIKAIPPFQPKNVWCPEAALFGQNDYIDILGDGTIHPVQLMSHIPKWLRGLQGNEMKILCHRLSATQHYWSEYRPKKFYDMRKRLRYLHRFLNHKTKT